MKLLYGLAGALGLLYLADTALGSERLLRRHLPPEVADSPALGRLAGTERLDLAIGLPLRNQQALTNLLQQLYDPASPLFRKYLTPAQFAEQFAPTEQDYQAVKDFAASRGLAVTGSHPNRTLLNVRGSVTNIERAFHVTLQKRSHPREARTFYAPDRDPAVDESLPILTVSGLDNYVLARPMSLVAKKSISSSSATPNVGSGPGGTYMGNDFRAAYAPGVLLTGAGQTVGLLEFSGFYPADITRYKTQTGLPDVPVNTVLVDGTTGQPDENNIEVALDIEMAISMAPGLSQVLVYEEPNAGNPNTVLNRIATDNIAKQISASWQYAIDASTEQIFQQFAAQGQSFFNASGDNGAYVGMVAQPSDDPYITIVGGTRLAMSGAGAAWQAETAWNYGRVWNSQLSRYDYYAGGGGISTTYTIPAWQQRVDMSANQGSTTMRNIPDVAMVASDVLVFYDGGRSDSCFGTSIAAPLWAAFTALVNEQASSNGLSSVGFINPVLYALGGTPGYPTIFHDVTVGNITTPSSPDRFFAAPGYDLCTGWGTPTGSNLINAFFTPLSQQPPAKPEACKL
jgi:subtilase family serine protease